MNRVPLAERMRPESLDEVIGQDAIIGDGKILTEIVKNGEPVNLIFGGHQAQGRPRWREFWLKNLTLILWNFRP